MVGDNISLDVEYAQKAGLNTIFVNTDKITTDIKTLTVPSVLDINDDLINTLERKELELCLE